jgi:hypothetical protein
MSSSEEKKEPNPQTPPWVLEKEELEAILDLRLALTSLQEKSRLSR